jgi:hypothetical protein
VTDNLSLWHSYRRALFRPAICPEQALRLPPLMRHAERVSELRKLQRYRQLCQIASSSHLPPCWLSVLSFPLQLSLLTDPALPLPAMGMLHVRNQIRQLRPIPEQARLQLQATLATPLRHAKGILLTITSSAYLDKVMCWQQRAEYLYRTPAAVVTSLQGTAENDPCLPKLTQLSVTPQLSRGYAKLSGDLNPIHLSAFTARCFGLPAALAHGMHVKAMILAQLTLPDGAFTVDVNFTRPFYLPGQADLSSAGQPDGEQRFRLIQKTSQKPILSGHILPI